MRVLEFTGLAPRPSSLARNLTLPDRKRLEVARALATRPELLLLDEVVAGLNPTETDMMIALIRRLRESGITIIMVEHVMRAVLGVSDRIMVLSFGEKIAEGTPKQVATPIPRSSRPTWARAMPRRRRRTICGNQPVGQAEQESDRG